MKTPLVSFQANVSGFMEIIDAARQAEVKSFVYASSSSVYGDHPALPKVESVTGNVLSPYAATKAADELFAGTYARCYGMRVAGMRYFNVFGARQDANGAYAAVIPRWIATLLRQEAVQINGDGQTSRDFCYIDNVVQANIRAALTLADDEPGTADVFNVAASRRTTLLELAELLRKLIQEVKPDLQMPDPVFADFRPATCATRWPTSATARSVWATSPATCWKTACASRCRGSSRTRPDRLPSPPYHFGRGPRSLPGASCARPSPGAKSLPAFLHAGTRIPRHSSPSCRPPSSRLTMGVRRPRLSAPPVNVKKYHQNRQDRQVADISFADTNKHRL